MIYFLLSLAAWQLCIQSYVYMWEKKKKKGTEAAIAAHGCLVFSYGCVDAARWSSPLGDMIRAPLLSNDAILGWLTSQLTRRCFISFFRINVCLSSTSKATSQGSLTTPSFIWFIYKPCPCAWLSFCTHLAVHGWLHWSNLTSTNDVCKTTAAAGRNGHLSGSYIHLAFHMLRRHEVKSTTLS